MNPTNPEAAVAALAWVALAAALFIPLLGHQYVAHLPYAPECPRCRSVTAQLPPASAADRVLAALAGAFARTCSRCGWAGRMRWRLSPRRVDTTPRG
jgi:hypothetical protein